MPSYDIAVLGGGVVGCAIALALTERPGLRVLVLEKEPTLGFHQTGHNSGVIHSGLYYKPGSLKARLCFEGRAALYRFCDEQGLRHARTGKLVVATRADELPRLADLEARGVANGLAGLKRLTPGEMREHEPHVSGLAGLFVPDTGVVDYADVTRAYARVAAERGALVETAVEVQGVRREAGGLVLETTAGERRARFAVTAAGLQSDRVARLCGLEPGARIVPFRGEYVDLYGASAERVRALVYPVPDPRFPFLGVHFTRGIDGHVHAGPNALVAWAREGYRRFAFSARDAADLLGYGGFWRLALRHGPMGLAELWRSLVLGAFLASMRRMIPDVARADLARGTCGIRAQAVGPGGALLDDFHLVADDRVIAVIDAPSPAATASLAIGRHVAELARERFGL
jgi:L-2-hydroxyglutarate oxidase